MYGEAQLPWHQPYTSRSEAPGGYNVGKVEEIVLTSRPAYIH
jgi:hypothetical protein